MSSGPWKYKFTLKDLAEAVSMTEAEVKLAKRRDEFDPSSIRSVIQWAFARIAIKRLTL